jgi:hypothetical protein
MRPIDCQQSHSRSGAYRCSSPSEVWALLGREATRGGTAPAAKVVVTEWSADALRLIRRDGRPEADRCRQLTAPPGRSRPEINYRPPTALRRGAALCVSGTAGLSQRVTDECNDGPGERR